MKNLPESFVSRRDDFVFCSGGRRYGNIEQVLKDFGLARDTMTQFLITGIQFTAFRPQDRSVQLGFDAGGTEKWAGECSACGKWQGAIADRLERNAIRCNTHFYREWRRLMVSSAIIDFPRSMPFELLDTYHPRSGKTSCLSHASTLLGPSGRMRHQ